MNWTATSNIKRQVNRLWERRILLAAIVTGESLFPLRLTLKGPSSAEISDRFTDVRKWVQDLGIGDGDKYRVVWRELNHRVVGRNSIPKAIWIDSLEDALDLIGKRAEANVFKTIVDETRQRRPSLLPWLERYPFKVLELAADWTRFLDIIDWLSARPRPGVYLRQIDLPGVHTKFIECHRGVLAELFELALPPTSICEEATGAAGFCRRYGFRDKPLRVRFRILDSGRPLFSPATDQDITVAHDTFAGLHLPLQRVFITENETNFLAFPMVEGSMVIFGAGYGFEMLAEAAWLQEREIHYWGDIDTHGFAILDQLRFQFSHVRSFLMDRETLFEHRLHWVTEPTPLKRHLARLTIEEGALYDDLLHNRLGWQLRLEQERIGFSWLQRFLTSLA